MRICHITPRLPPDYSAVSQLPACLGSCFAAGGDTVEFVTCALDPHGPPTHDDLAPGPIIRVAHEQDGGRRIGPAFASAALRAAWPAVRRADIVHLHGDGALVKAGALAAEIARKPAVLTLFGSEIWEYRRRRWRVDLFARAYRRAAHVAFYSQGLLTHAMQLGLGRRESSVIYPPVLDVFTFHDAQDQAEARAALGLRSRHILVTVKRVDELGGHRILLEALSEVIRTHPDTRLVICGTGPLLAEMKDAARSWGVEGHVTFTGALAPDVVARYDAAADAFVLPSRLDSCPPGALEALACGTPVVASDNPGGLELRELFGFDVSVVPRDNAVALARTLGHFLQDKRRVRASTVDLLDREFRLTHVAAQYRAVYRRALARAVPAVPAAG